MNFDISSKLLEKMWDTIVDKGVSALLRPWQMKRENKARLECIKDEKLEMIKIDNEAKKLQLSLDREQFIDAEIVPQIEQIASETLNTKIHEIVKEEISVAKAIEYAGEYIEEKQMQDEKPSEKPSEDWLNKWKNRTKEFTDDDALKMWGRVLAGEFASPGRYSYKFLDWMSNITPKDAELISKLMENVFDVFYFRGEKMDKEMPLTFGELLALQELEVLQGVDGLGLTMTLKTKDANTFKNIIVGADGKKMILIDNPDPLKSLVIKNICILTKIGREVKSLCNVETNENAVKKVGEYIAKMGFDVSWADIISKENNAVNTTPLNKIVV